MLKMIVVSLALTGLSAFPAPWDAGAEGVGLAERDVLVASVPQAESPVREKVTFDDKTAEVEENEEKPAPSSAEAEAASDEQGILKTCFNTARLHLFPSALKLGKSPFIPSGRYDFAFSIYFPTQKLAIIIITDKSGR